MRAVWRVLPRHSPSTLPRTRVGALNWRRCASNDATAPSESRITPALLSRARSLAQEHDTLEKQLLETYDNKVARKIGELSRTSSALKAWESTESALKELQQLLKDESADAELRSIAEEELADTEKAHLEAATTLRTALAPVHEFAHLPCLIEIRPGAGGDEAGIFAGDLVNMYTAYCRTNRMPLNVLTLNQTSDSTPHVSEAVLEVCSEHAYGIMRCEAGVHRVQRVPATEAKGRTHTSAVSVLVLPSFPPNISDELGEQSFLDPRSDYFIDPKDVKMDVMRASGAGGQHVNTTESAVRLTYFPMNIVVAMQESRSQQANREKAWQVLRARVAQARKEAREDELAAMRLSVVGLNRMGRGDKIRTYNWGQQRVTDHRSGLTVHGLDDVMGGGDTLEKVMQSVRLWMTDQELLVQAADDAAESRSKGGEK